MFTILLVVSALHNILIILRLEIHLRYIGQLSIKKLFSSKSDITAAILSSSYIMTDNTQRKENHSSQNLGHETLWGTKRNCV